MIDIDQGSIAGTWRDRRNRLALSISRPFAPGRFTFVAEAGPESSGGMLVALGNGRYRIERYQHVTQSHGDVWRGGPAVAPFDGTEVEIVRSGIELSVEGRGARLRLQRIRGVDLYARIEQLYGRWHLAEGGRVLAGADAATLELSSDRFAVMAPCRSFASSGSVALADLIIAPGGSQEQRWVNPACNRLGRGDRLAEQSGTARFAFAVRANRIDAYLGSELFEFVRG